MASRPDTVLLACEHKFHCIVDGATFSDTLNAILKAHADSRCPCSLSGCDRAWISSRPQSSGRVPNEAVRVSMDDVVDMYEPPMVWFGSAWDIEPTCTVPCFMFKWWLNLPYADVTSAYKTTYSIPSETSRRSSSSKTFKPREAFIVLRPGLLRCGNNPNVPVCLPPSNVGYTTASRISGAVWIDKTGAMDDMDRLGAPLSLIRRPSGFGKTCFAMMNLFYHSALTDAKAFNAMFSATTIKSSTPHGIPRSSGRLSLLFDLAEVSKRSVRNFKDALQVHVQSSIITFMGQYASLFKYDPSTKAALPGRIEKDGFFCIEGIRHLIGLSGWTLFVVIDNYDAPARAYNNNTRVTSLIDAILVRPLRDLGGLVADGLILGGYMEGDDGDYRNENEDDDENWVAPHPWNKISEDYTRHPYVDAAFGVSVDEIAWLCKAISPEDRLLLGRILQDVQSYQFGPDVELTCGTRDVIDAIRARTGCEGAAYLSD